MKRALFLDRDGVLMEDRHYMRDPGDVYLIAGAAEALRRFAAEGWLLIVISNQSGVGRGFISVAEMEAVQSRFLELLRDEDVEITATYICPHAPDAGCECRKPSPYLLRKAAEEHGIDLAESWMIGDKESDVSAGAAAGCRTVLFRGDVSWAEIAL